VSLKRALRHVLLAVVLLVAQQAGYEHALSHFDQSSPASKKKQVPHTNACSKCGLSAQLGTGLLSNPETLIPAARSACVALRRFQAFHPTAPRRFLSRAPPASL